MSREGTDDRFNVECMRTLLVDIIKNIVRPEPVFLRGRSGT
jgi:hypothetical protein